MTKLEIILDTKKILFSKLVFIIVKWFLNWCLISNQDFLLSNWFLFNNFLVIICMFF